MADEGKAVKFEATYSNARLNKTGGAEVQLDCPKSELPALVNLLLLIETPLKVALVAEDDKIVVGAMFEGLMIRKQGDARVKFSTQDRSVFEFLGALDEETIKVALRADGKANV